MELFSPSSFPPFVEGDAALVEASDEGGGLDPGVDEPPALDELVFELLLLLFFAEFVEGPLEPVPSEGKPEGFEFEGGAGEAGADLEDPELEIFDPELLLDEPGGFCSVPCGELLLTL